MNWIKLNKITDIDFNQPLIVVYGIYQSELTAFYHSVLSSEEQIRYASIRNKTELHCRAVLRLLLSSLLALPLHEINILTTGKGKPYCANCSVHFNVSHTNKSYIIALSRSGRIGIDMEQLTGNEDLVAMVNYAFSTEEIQLFVSSQNSADIFCKIWTLKEAFLKALGLGLTKKITKINVTEKTRQFGFSIQTFCCPQSETVTFVHKQSANVENAYWL